MGPPVPRLGDLGLQAQHPPTTSSSPGSWPATSCRTPHPRADPGHGLHPRAARRTPKAARSTKSSASNTCNERAELVGKAFLGLTVGCAKCHDHKYDIISQADYYSMGGFFNSDGRARPARLRPRHPAAAATSSGRPRCKPRTSAAAQKVTAAKEAAYQAASGRGDASRRTPRSNAVPAAQRA